MSRNHRDIDAILRKWPFEPGVVTARLIQASDGREVLQMRIEMGVLQMETRHRPDGARPGGADTYLDHLRQNPSANDEEFLLDEHQCLEIDREFLQYYHRRICWLALRRFDGVIADADHTLALMDFVASHSPDQEWTLSHEQYRPFVLFHRAQAAALAALEASGPEAAIEMVTSGVDQIRGTLGAIDAEEQLEEDPLVAQLVKLREWIRKEHRLGPTLSEQLAEAVASERYELAAKLRDEIARRERAQRS